MLASITPLGERGRARRWRVSASSLVAGSVAGGLLVGALAGGFGALALAAVDLGTTARLGLLAGAALLALAVDLRPARTRAPGPRRQVNEQWLEVYREWVYGGGFGLQLGAAVLTQVATAAVYVMLLAAALTGSVVAGALVGGVFGLGRALPVLATWRVHDTGALAALHRRSAALAGPARALTSVVLAGTALALLVGAGVSA
jgi:sulfite exporter TauE/SafE